MESDKKVEVLFESKDSAEECFAVELQWFKNTFEKKYFAPNRRIERDLKVLSFAIGVSSVIWYIRRRIFES